MMFSSYSGGAGPQCPFDDSGFTVLLPNPENCSTFFLCSNGVPILMSYPDGLHFNDRLDTCDWPRYAGCDDGGGIVIKKCYTVFSSNIANDDYYASCSGAQNGSIM